MDYLTLGPNPAAEECFSSNDYTKSKEEGIVYKHQLERLFPIPQDVRAKFKVKSFPHEYGDYIEVCIVYDDNDEVSTDFAFLVEDNIPEYWDDESLKELKEKGIKQ